MLEEIQRRNYSHRTAKSYVRVVRDFAEYFHCSPDKLGPEHIRQYQAYLFQTKKLTSATVSQCVSALRFLFVKTLRRHFFGGAHSISQVPQAATDGAQPRGS
jgi:site-specific recombinase XerD